MRYVTYDGDGNLTGCYLQELAHTDYIEIDEFTAQRWVDYKANGQRNGLEAGTPVAPPPLPVPASVSPRQIRQALTRVGLRDAVENAIAYSDKDAQDWYKYATEFKRDHEMVSALSVALKVSSAQLDALFVLAASL